MADKVRVLVDIAGHQLRYRAGDEVDQEAFASRVGAGWRGLCEPVGPGIERAAVTLPQSRNPLSNRKRR